MTEKTKQTTKHENESALLRAISYNLQWHNNEIFNGKFIKPAVYRSFKCHIVPLSTMNKVLQSDDNQNFRDPVAFDVCNYYGYIQDSVPMDTMYHSQKRQASIKDFKLNHYVYLGTQKLHFETFAETFAAKDRPEAVFFEDRLYVDPAMNIYEKADMVASGYVLRKMSALGSDRQGARHQPILLRRDKSGTIYPFILNFASSHFDIGKDKPKHQDVIDYYKNMLKNQQQNFNIHTAVDDIIDDLENFKDSMNALNESKGSSVFQASDNYYRFCQKIYNNQNRPQFS